MCIMDVDLSPSHTVKEIKQLLSERTSIPVESFALFYKGKFLHNNHALSEYGMSFEIIIMRRDCRIICDPSDFI